MTVQLALEVQQSDRFCLFRLSGPQGLRLSAKLPYPDAVILVQRQISSGTYDNAIDVLLAGVQLLEQEPMVFPEEDLAELKKAVQIGWEASQRGEVVDGPTAMNQILADLRSRYADK
jgi:antitoxin ParD1/3/4